MRSVALNCSITLNCSIIVQVALASPPAFSPSAVSSSSASPRRRQLPCEHVLKRKEKKKKEKKRLPCERTCCVTCCSICSLVLENDPPPCRRRAHTGSALRQPLPLARLTQRRRRARRAPWVGVHALRIVAIAAAALSWLVRPICMLVCL